MTTINLRPITAAQARLPRHTVLRPHHSPETLVYPGDSAPDSLHVGAFLNDKLVGIASVSRERFPDEPRADAWRLRGMATLPEARRMGYGVALVRACIAHVAARGGTLIWCHGRTSALPFYAALGFKPHGEEFNSPSGTGPHYVLRRNVLPNEEQNQFDANGAAKGLRCFCLDKSHRQTPRTWVYLSY